MFSQAAPPSLTAAVISHRRARRTFGRPEHARSRHQDLHCALGATALALHSSLCAPSWIIVCHPRVVRSTGGELKSERLHTPTSIQIAASRHLAASFSLLHCTSSMGSIVRPSWGCAHPHSTMLLRWLTGAESRPPDVLRSVIGARTHRHRVAQVTCCVWPQCVPCTTLLGHAATNSASSISACSLGPGQHLRHHRSPGRIDLPHAGRTTDGEPCQPARATQVPDDLAIGLLAGSGRYVWSRSRAVPLAIHWSHLTRARCHPRGRQHHTTTSVADARAREPRGLDQNGYFHQAPVRGNPAPTTPPSAAGPGGHHGVEQWTNCLILGPHEESLSVPVCAGCWEPRGNQPRGLLVPGTGIDASQSGITDHG